MEHEMTDDEFAAWIEWRKWCSVWRVKDPQPTNEELESGKTDDKTEKERQKYYSYLYKYIASSIQKKLTLWEYKNNIKRHHPKRDELISVFDTYMKDSKKKSQEGFSGKSYKDFVFYQISISSDPPGRVLNGKIFGKLGYIHDILVKYLSENGWLEKGPRDGITKIPLKNISMDAPLNEDDERDLYDKLGSEMEYEDEDEESVIAWIKELQLTREEKLVLWAKANGIAVSNPKLCKVLHCAKEKADKTLKGVFHRLKTEAGDLLTENSLKTVLFWIEKDLGAEKEAASFLYESKGEKEGECHENL